MVPTILPPPLEKANLASWRAGILRLTVFRSPPGELIEQNWWEVLRGQPPENVTSSPRQAAYEAIGPWEAGGQSDASLVLVIQRFKIEWRLQQIADPQTEEIELLGSAPEAITAFRDVMLQWLPTCPPTSRIAFGAVLLLPVADLSEGYRRIIPYVGVDLDLDNSRDFHYQINRRRPSQVMDDLQLNRLARWSVGTVQEQSISIAPGQAVSTAPGREYSACRIELDMNTVPSNEGSLPADSLPAIFQELIRLGEEIAANGDVP